jgi:tetratricopeptide (TPR) repeat protein
MATRQSGTIERLFKTVRGLPPVELTLEQMLGHEKAQELCWQAMDLCRPNRAIELTLQAFRMCPLCADVFNLAATYLAQDDGERLSLYRWAVRVAELYLGSKVFLEDRGDFYSVLNTRPYMRARFQLGLTLRKVGLFEEALKHFEELVELDTTDHLGARLILMTAYLESRLLTKARELIDRHRDDAGLYASYSNLICCWCKGAGKGEFSAALKRALYSNEHVPTLLEKPDTPVQFSGLGVSWSGLDGAAEYLQISCRLWEANPKLKRRLIREAAELVPIVRTEREEMVRSWRQKLA